MGMAATLLVSLSFAATAQRPLDGVEILKKVEETYKNVKQYEIETDITFQDPDTKENVSSHLRVAFRTPDKYREEARGGILSLNRTPGDPEEALMVYDGSNLWAYNPKSNEYRDYVVPHLPRDSRPEDMDLYTGIGIYRHAVQLWGTPKLLKEESIAAAGGTVDCFVVQAVYGADLATVWIAKDTFHVLRVEGPDFSQVFRTVKLDEPLSDDFFKFEPPPGAKKLN